MGRLRTPASRIAPLDMRSVRPAPKTADPYYGSPEHRAWRAQVIARAGGRCEWLGCGRRERRMFADHVIERRDGGAATDLANGQCLCAQHHAIKTARARTSRLTPRLGPLGG
jgi:hypothetical protein